MTDKEPKPVRWYQLTESLGVDRGDLVILGSGTVLGGFVGYGIPLVIDHPTEVAPWAIVISALVATVTCGVIWSFLKAFQKHGRDQLDEISRSLAKQEESVTNPGSTDLVAAVVLRAGVVVRTLRRTIDAIVDASKQAFG